MLKNLSGDSSWRYGKPEKVTATESPEETRQLLDEIKAVQASGECNMLDLKAVFEIAVREGYELLADRIFTDSQKFSNFIISGNEEDF